MDGDLDDADVSIHVNAPTVTTASASGQLSACTVRMLSMTGGSEPHGERRPWLAGDLVADRDASIKGDAGEVFPAFEPAGPPATT